MYGKFRETSKTRATWDGRAGSSDRGSAAGYPQAGAAGAVPPPVPAQEHRGDACRIMDFRRLSWHLCWPSAPSAHALPTYVISGPLVVHIDVQYRTRTVLITGLSSRLLLYHTPAALRSTHNTHSNTHQRSLACCPPTPLSFHLAPKTQGTPLPTQRAEPAPHQTEERVQGERAHGPLSATVQCTGCKPFQGHSHTPHVTHVHHPPNVLSALPTSTRWPLSRATMAG